MVLSVISPGVLKRTAAAVCRKVVGNCTRVGTKRRLATLPVSFSGVGRVTVVIILLCLFSNLFDLTRRIVVAGVSRGIICGLHHSIGTGVGIIPIGFCSARDGKSLVDQVIGSVSGVTAALRRDLVRVVADIVAFIKILTLVLSVD